MTAIGVVDKIISHNKAAEYARPGHIQHFQNAKEQRKGSTIGQHWLRKPQQNKEIDL